MASPAAGTEQPYVVLLHTLPDGRFHFDLLIAVAGREGLLTWRLPTWGPADEPLEGVIAEQLPDHRRAYLTYEGPVSGNRGEVKRVEAGTVRLGQCDGQIVRGTMTLDDGTQRIAVLMNEAPTQTANRRWSVYIDPA